MMLKILIKKQLNEVFRGYFYNPKTNRTRSKASTAGYILMFVGIMVGVLGMIFTNMARMICTGLCDAGMDWLYFLIMSGVSILMGAFGSVFNTFSGLYLSKDNDLLLSMPIPVKYIIISRLMNVYLLGLMYSSVGIVPTFAVYWSYFGITPSVLICAVVLFLIITLIVTILSCLLGFCVAKISLKLKRKNFITVFISLAFICGYYFFYYKAQAIISNLVTNAQTYGEKIKGTSLLLYLFGKIGCGDIKSAMIFLAATALAVCLTWLLLRNTFLSIATSSDKADKKVYREKTARKRSAFEALFIKELSKFTSSPNYMLNCGLGIIIIPVVGIIILIKGNYLLTMLSQSFAEYPQSVFVLLCAGLITISSMNDIAAPSVSLEGKSIWIPQSLPVDPATVLQAKKAVHILLSGIPLLFTSVCIAATVENASLLLRILIAAVPMAFLFFSANFALFMGIKMPVLNWTNEIIPIKQSAAVFISLFSGWVIAAVFALLYLMFFYTVDTVIYLSVWLAITIVMTLILSKWVRTKGAAIFSNL